VYNTNIEENTNNSVTINTYDNVYYFYKEREQLVNKLIAKELTKEEQARLKYLDWQIDKLEVEELGPDFADIIEGYKEDE